MTRLPETAYFPLTPDWVCEVVSPATARLDRAKKLLVYAREGIAHCWIVDPLACTLEVFRLESGRWTLAMAHEGHDIIRRTVRRNRHRFHAALGRAGAHRARLVVIKRLN